MSRLSIVAAVIFDENENRVFITKRLPTAHQAGFWEFPGGKVEENEENEQALLRELKEELGIDVVKYQELCSFDYDYPNKPLHFTFYIVNKFNGNPYGREGQEGKWVKVIDLKNQDFPEANRIVLERIR